LDLIVAVKELFLLKCRKALKPDGRYVMVGGALTQIFKAIVKGSLCPWARKKMLFWLQNGTSATWMLVNLCIGRDNQSGD
jgi:hypothetical protein